MSRRTQQQAKHQEVKDDGDLYIEIRPKGYSVEDSKKFLAEHVQTVNDPSAHVPADVMEKAKKIREALTTGKAVCDGCLRIFSGKLGLKVHKGHGCKGRNG